MAKTKTASKNSKGTAPPLAPPPPKPASRGTKGAPERLPTSGNLTKTPASGTVLINFRVSPEFRKELKGEALELDMTVSELLRKMYDCWKTHRGR